MVRRSLMPVLLEASTRDHHVLRLALLRKLLASPDHFRSYGERRRVRMSESCTTVLVKLRWGYYPVSTRITSSQQPALARCGNLLDPALESLTLQMFIKVVGNTGNVGRALNDNIKRDQIVPR
jgi:hypothetical protein